MTFFKLILCVAVLGWTSALANPFIADSPWPMAHQNPGQSSVSSIAGPLGRPDVTRYRSREDADVKLGTSPWHVISGASYPTAPGVRTVWGASLTHAYKYALRPDGLSFVDALPLTRLGSISWNLISLASENEARVIVPQPRGMREGGAPCRGREPALIELRDGLTPYVSIRCVAKFELSDEVVRSACPVPRRGWRQGYSATRTGISYSGEIVTNATYVRRGSFGATKVNYLILLDNALSRIVGCVEVGPGISTNNVPAEPLPGGGTAFYVATETELVRIDWTGGRLNVTWRVPVGFRGRTGTTPTLVDAEGERLVVMVDGICAVTQVFTGKIECSDPSTGPSRLISVDRQTGKVSATDLPTIIRTVENSPSFGNGRLVIANYGGYRAAPEVKGVVAMRRSNGAWQVDWVNDQVQMNGIPTISTGSNAVYSSGIGPTGQVEAIGLALTGPKAGTVVMRTMVGDPADWLDAGVNTIIAADGTLIYGADAGIVQIGGR